MYAFLFNSDGPVVQIPVPNGQKVADRFYKNNVGLPTQNGVQCYIGKCISVIFVYFCLLLNNP